MKVKKLLAVVLTAIIFVLPLAVFSAAEGETLEIQQYPFKDSYSDGEAYNPDNICVYDGMNYYSYSDVPSRFSFEPAVVSCANTQVVIYFDGVMAGVHNINVAHTPQTEAVSFGKNHGYYCEKCGKVARFEDHHVVADGWIPNDDATFLTNETETGVCDVCGESVSRPIDGTAGYLKVFNPDKNPIIVMVVEMLAQFISTIKGLAV